MNIDASLAEKTGHSPENPLAKGKRIFLGALALANTAVAGVGIGVLAMGELGHSAALAGAEGLVGGVLFAAVVNKVVNKAFGY